MSPQPFSQQYFDDQNPFIALEDNTPEKYVFQFPTLKVSPNNVSVQVCSKSINSFRRYSIGNSYVNIFHGLVALGHIRSSPKYIQL